MLVEFLTRVPDFDNIGKKAFEDEEQGFDENDFIEDFSPEGELRGRALRIPFKYEPFVIDLSGVFEFGKEDEEHVKIISGDNFYVLKIDYGVFKQIYCTATGRIVMTTRDFKILQ